MADIDSIRIRGARENNLCGFDLDIPRGRLVVLTGVSGSGKTSLALDTLHAEGQRRYLEAMAGALRVRTRLERPRVDDIEGLPPTIALDQSLPHPGPRSTIGTLADAEAPLRVLMARGGVQHCCGCGDAVVPVTHDEIVAAIAAQPEGSRITVEAPLNRGEIPVRALLDEVARAGFSRVRIDGTITRVEEVRPRAGATLRVVVDRIRWRPDRRDRLHDAVRTAARAGRGAVVAVVGDGETTFVDRPICLRCPRHLPPLEPRLLSTRGPGACETCRGVGSVESEPCGACDATGLGPDARAVRLVGHRIEDIKAWSLADLHQRLGEWEVGEAARLPLEALRRRVDALVRIGLASHPMGARTARLSTGELQRARLARHLATPLCGVLYLLDEPTTGFDEASSAGVVTWLRELRDAGNTVVVIEHNPVVVRAADHVIDFGPGSGSAGGRIVYQGDVAGLEAADTVTAAWLARSRSLPPLVGSGGRDVAVQGLVWRAVSTDLSLPLGAATAITGPTGSGKSTLLDAMRRLIRPAEGQRRPRVASLVGVQAVTRLADVLGHGASSLRRSTAATYSGAWDTLRTLLAATQAAQVRGLPASHFSLNRKGGRCEVCAGQGEVRVDLSVLPDVWLPCDVCRGRRFHGDVLEVRWKGHGPDELLALRADEAYRLLAGHPRLEASLRALCDVGLGYLPLGQPGHTWSGGEVQRLRIARELARMARGGGADTVFVLDDPTRGLHPADVHALTVLLQRLVDEGATLWIATHDQRFAAVCAHEVRMDEGRAIRLR